MNNCRKRNICPRVCACVLACFRVHNRSPDGQELSFVTPSSRVRSHRRRRMTNSTASETSAALHRPVASACWCWACPVAGGRELVPSPLPCALELTLGQNAHACAFPLLCTRPGCPHQSRDDAMMSSLRCTCVLCYTLYCICEPTLRVSAVRT